MDFTFSIGLWAVVALVVASVVFGIAAQLFGSPGFGYEWIGTSIAAFVGAFATSEFVVGLRDYAPVFDGVAILPAVAGGAVLGLLFVAVARMLSSDTYHSRPVS